MEREKVNINVFTAFSGYDSQCMALERLQEMYPWFSYNLVGWSEIDEPAIASHNAVFPEAADKNYGDISKVDWSQVPDFDLFTYSSPCFIVGTKVIMSDGTFKNIEDVNIGDEVISHTGNIRKVIGTMKHEYSGRFLIEVKGSIRNSDDASYRFSCTPNHRFWILEKGKTEPVWKPIRELCFGDRLCYYDSAALVNEKYTWFTPDNYELVELVKPVEVYNLSVEVDESYQVDYVICHNCQDFSISGNQRGGEKGTGTRSSLLWECERTIREKRPKYCLLENVKALYADKKFHPLLMRWKNTVNNYGYKSWIQVLNAADYDIPQGRERVFMVSIRTDVIEKDFGGLDYMFPAPMKRTRQIEDFVVTNEHIPEEYYLKEHKIPKFLNLLNHAGDEFDDNLTDEQKEAITSVDYSSKVTDKDIRSISYETEVGGYAPKKDKENALIQ